MTLYSHSLDMVITSMMMCSPLPTIAWSRIVQGNNSLSVANVRENSETFVLSVVNVQPADVGDYICNASNGVGQLVATLRIRGDVLC